MEVAASEQFEDVNLSDKKVELVMDVKEDKKVEKEVAGSVEVKKEEKEAVDPLNDPSKQVPFSDLYRYSDLKDKFYLVIGALMAMANGVTLPMFSLIFGDLLNSFNQSDDSMYAAIKLDALYFFLIGIGSFFCSWGSLYFYISVGERQTRRIREAYVKAILRQNMAWFNAHSAGELSTRLAADTELINEGIGQKAAAYIQFNSTFVAGLIMGLVRGWQLALVIVAITPLLAIGGGVMTYLVGKYAKAGSDAYAKAGDVADETLTSVKTVASMNAEQSAKDKYSIHVTEAMEAGIFSSYLNATSVGTVMLLVFGSYGLALWYGAKLIADGTYNSGTGAVYTGGDVVTVFFAVLMGAFAVGQAAPSVPAFNNAKGSAFRIFETIDRVPPIDSSSKEGTTLPELKGDIVFEDVHFAYPSRPDAPVLKGLNLTIPIGKSVALVGQSGCGKSTIINLLERWYDPTSGRILVDGVDLKTLNLQWWRSRLGLVQQEPVLFAVTLKENIQYGKNDANDAEIDAALKSANAWDFVSKLPDQCNTSIGESGAEQLSGGQKQRIAIARAIVKNPQVLLLDEATSALDNESEHVVQDALDKLMLGRTCVMIAHRLSTIRDADIICVFDDGKVCEQGNHSSLIESNGLYSALVRADSKKSTAGSNIDKPDEIKRSVSVDKSNSVKIDISSSNVVTADSKSTAENEKADVNEIPVSRVYSLMSDYWYILVLSILCAFANGAIMPSFSQIFAEMLSVFYISDREEMRNKSANLAWAFFGIGVGMFLVNFGQRGGFAYVGERLTRNLREMSFASVLRQDMSFFDAESTQPRMICANLATEAGSVREAAAENIAYIVQVSTMLLAGVILAFIYCWQLAFVVLGVGPLIAVAGALQMKFVAGAAGESQKTLGKGNQLASEAISGIRTISSFNAENLVTNRYSELLDIQLVTAHTRAHVAGAGFGVSQFIIFCSYSACFVFGGWLIYNKFTTFPDVLKCFFAIVMSAMGIGQSTAFATDTVKAKAAMKSIFGLIDRVPAIDSENSTGSPVVLANCDISFEKVTFAYSTRPDVPIFTNMNFRIKSGSKVALVGPSGGGKSTVISMLLRFYEPNSGTICLGDRNITEFNIKSLRSQIGYVSQEPVLFAKSIMENIRMARTEATDEECIQAAKFANAHDFISEFPDKYNTLVGPRGSQLSGGQKQRVAIARALLRDPKLLLLDEATSALDNNSEVVVQEALNKLMVGRTTLIVAHRLSTVRNADLILVVKGGEIVESGKYDDLISLNGVFTALASGSAGAELSLK